MTTTEITGLIVCLLPLLSGLLSFSLGRKASIGGTLFHFVAFGVSLYLNFSVTANPLLVGFEWIPGQSFGWYIDRLAAALISLVLFVSALVHLFSVYYMKSEPRIHQYYAFLGFFTFSMLGLLASDHLLLLFIFWELVGFSSYLLIGFWYQDSQKAFSSRFAFITNRIADAGLLGAILLLWSYSDSLLLSDLVDWQVSPDIMQIAGFGLLIGALGKSAQFPFFPWLPRAMAGPTPVSALIHAATMVAAGVYLLIRVSPVLTEDVLIWTAFIGAITAFTAAFAALTQHDIKKVLAYSTVSQLGYMVMGIGVGAVEMSFFHLWTHAFFKAGLFLGAGSVIHFMHHQERIRDPQDMRTMGGLKPYLPWTFWTYTVCMLSLSGLPFFTGFFSKEGVVSAAFRFAEGAPALYWLVPVMGFITVLFTAFYMTRQLLLIFFGPTPAEAGFQRQKEPVMTVIVPLVLLAMGSLWVLYNANPVAHEFLFLAYVFGYVVEVDAPIAITIISVGLASAGLIVGLILYRRGALIQNLYLGRRLRLISLYAFGVDHFYWYAVARAVDHFTIRLARIDTRIIDYILDRLGIAIVVLSKLADLLDKFIVDGIVRFVAFLAGYIGRVATLFTSARAQLHVVWLVLGVLLLLFLLK